jgi:hypothetical protein
LRFCSVAPGWWQQKGWKMGRVGELKQEFGEAVGEGWVL